MSPIFLISLPRSGSTLVQRILLAHRGVASASEPWILLPLVAVASEKASISMMANFSIETSKMAANDFYAEENHFWEACRDFATTSYSKKMREEDLFFLDKTPRYYLIVDEIIKIFPNAKIIFLFRDLIEIYDSILNTWHDDETQVNRNYIDLFHGPKLLSDAKKKHEGNSFALTYSDLIKNPEGTIRNLVNFLGLSFDPSIIDRIGEIVLKGKMGDKRGAGRSGIKRERSDRKSRTAVNIFLARKIINLLSDDVLESFGSTREEYLTEIGNISLSNFISRRNFKDAYYVIRDSLYRYILRWFVARGVLFSRRSPWYYD